MEALAFLEKIPGAKPQPVYVLSGSEGFLKRQVLAALQTLLLGDGDPAFAWTALRGDEAQWAMVRSELETLPFLSPRRVVAIEGADKFVTDHRATLEKYVAAPASAGVLVLEVRTWPATTKLAKQVSGDATIVCAEQKNPGPWCARRARESYGKTLGADAANWLVELVGPDLGLLDQELAKLSAYVGAAKSIAHDDVDRLVGRSRAAETFKIFEAIGAGQPARALAILHRLFDENAEPLAILGAFSWQLRKLATIARATLRGSTLAAAMEAANVKPFFRDGTEQQLRHLGRRRLVRLFDWLIEADRAMKSSGELPERVVLERLLVRLARPRASSFDEAH